MLDGFDIVPIRVQGKGGVVSGVVSSFASRPIILTADSNSSPMEGIDSGMVGRLKGQVNAGDIVIGLINKKLIRKEKVLPFLKNARMAQGRKYGLIKAFISFPVFYPKMNMIE